MRPARMPATISPSFSLQATQPVATSTGLSSSAYTASLGQTLTFTAQVNRSGGGTPTGTVTFYNNGTAIGTVGLLANRTTTTAGR